MQYELINRLESFLKNSNIKYDIFILDNFYSYYNNDITINITIDNYTNIIFKENIDYETKCTYMNFILKVFDSFTVIK